MYEKLMPKLPMRQYIFRLDQVMKRVKMVVSYDGTNYCGWQEQPNGITVEEVLNRELSAFLKEDIHVIGASRTDSGVHALGNIAVFDTETRIPADKMCFALNQRLPADIVIQSSCEVEGDYHPRKRNTIKTYEYRILNRTFPIPSLRFNTHFVYMPLNVEKMQKAADYLNGEHDFVSFCSARNQAEDTIRTLYEVSVNKSEDVITIRLVGNGFLYNMVRIIAGTLMKVGLGVYPPEHVHEILFARDRNAAGPKAPACGLTLMGIEEQEELEPEFRNANDFFDYTVVQRFIAEKKKSYVIINRCTDNEFEQVLVHILRQQLRNGADKVYVYDAADRLCDRKQVGSYTFKAVSEEIDYEGVFDKYTDDCSGIYETEDYYIKSDTSEN